MRSGSQKEIDLYSPCLGIERFMKKYIYAFCEAINRGFLSQGVIKTQLCCDVIDGLMNFSKRGTTMLSGRSNAGRLAQVTAP